MFIESYIYGVIKFIMHHVVEIKSILSVMQIEKIRWKHNNIWLAYNIYYQTGA